MKNFVKKIGISLGFLLVFVSYTKANSRDLEGVDIVSREQWGANETRRFSALPYLELKEKIKEQNEERNDTLLETDIDAYIANQKAAYEKQLRNEYLATNFGDEQKIDKTLYKDLQGKDLKRPQSYHTQKTKIIIHHTAGDRTTFTGVDKVVSYLQDVYKYHTFNKQWGDIGYNFLIGPDGTIYEGRAGGEGVIGAHVTRNNTPSIGIGLIGNFDKTKVPDKQLIALTKLTIALVKKYNIDPLAKTYYHKQTKEYPYMQSIKNFTIAGHKDAGVTSCPGKNLYPLLPKIRETVVKELSQGTLVSYKNTTPISSISTSGSIQNQNDFLVQKRKQEYIKKYGYTAPKSTTKIASKISLDQVKTLVSGNVGVLLYEISQLKNRQIICENGCSIDIDNMNYKAAGIIVEPGEEGKLYINLGNQKLNANEIKIASTTNGLVTIVNHKKVSYKKIPRNTFRGEIKILQQQVKNLTTKKYQKQYVVINTLPVNNYLKGIIESVDSDPIEKITLMTLLAKTYTLFYLTGQNYHPSVPQGAAYQAIDHPDMFQKYVGAGAEKTLKKWPLALEKTKNLVLMYSGYVPILPYFHCAPGFTRSAKEKWGWTDTPYLVNIADADTTCKDFQGHGVGLSGKGAEKLAKQGWDRKKILQYYYPGVEVQEINL